MGPTVRRALLFLGLCVSPVFADDAFVVSTNTTGASLLSSAGSDLSGNFVIVWQGHDDAESGYGVFARRYDAGGVAQGGPFRVNSYTTGNQTSPSLAVLPDGRFVVAWFDAPRGAVVARRYAANGIAASGEFTVNSYTTVAPAVFFPSGGTSGSFEFADTPFPGPSVAADADGGFMVVWDSTANPDPCPLATCFAVQARRFDAAGTPEGAQFTISAFTSAGAAAETQPSVAARGDGQFVVVWNVSSGGSGAVAGWDSASAPVGQAFLVSSLTSATPLSPVVSSDGDGRFVATWNAFSGVSPVQLSLHAQYFGSAPAPGQGPALAASPVVAPVPTANSSLSVGLLARPHVSMDDDAAFIVAWPRGFFEDFGNGGITARHYEAGGAPAGPSFPVHQSSLDILPGLASQPQGAFVTSWSASGAGGQPTVMARRTGDATPPVVKVTSPNSAGRLGIGLTTPITWTASDADGLASFEVFLSRDGGGSYDPAPICASAASGPSPYACSWTVTGPATSQARVKVVATSNGGASGEDASDGNSTIAAPFVTVTAPDSPGVVWPAGKSRTIQLLHNVGKNQAILIEINRNYPAGSWSALSGSAGCSSTTQVLTSSCSWTVAGATSGATARIRASLAALPGVTDTNNASFEITSRVRVTTPNTALTWKAGQTRVLKWTHTYGVAKAFDVSLDNDGDGDCDDVPIHAGVAGTAAGGSYAWTVAGSGAQNRVCVRVSPADPDGNDASDAAFTITP